MALFCVVIDKKYEGTCAGVGIYFTYAENEKEAKKQAKKRCKDEREYDEARSWTVEEIKEVSENTPISEVIKEYPSLKL